MKRMKNMPKQGADHTTPPMPEQKQPTTIPQPPVENMEVHHHAHHAHGKKNWRSYGWEFIMLFLAVFCGYLAEYRLERTIEKHREEDYINSFIKNIESDRSSLDSIIKRNKTRQLYLDSLVRISQADMNEPENVKKVYDLYIKARRTFPNYTPNDATIQQLKSSGNFRLIKRTEVVDSILAYDAANRLIENRTELYTNIIQASWEASYPVLDITIIRDSSYFTNDQLIKQPPDIVVDVKSRKIFFNAMMREVWFIGIYVTMLQKQRAYADRIIPFVQKAYDLD